MENLEPLKYELRTPIHNTYPDTIIRRLKYKDFYLYLINVDDDPYWEEYITSDDPPPVFLCSIKVRRIDNEELVLTNSGRTKYKLNGWKPIPTPERLIEIVEANFNLNN